MIITSGLLFCNADCCCAWATTRHVYVELFAVHNIRGGWTSQGAGAMAMQKQKT
jgi:hypothetical protein